MRLFYSGRHSAPLLPGTAALSIDGLHVRYAGTGAAVTDITMRVEQGERVALIGPNGAGKSSLLKAIAGLLPAAGGEIRIFGLPVGACHHRVAYLPQRSEIDWRFPITLRGLALTGRYVHLGWLRRPAASDRALADAALAQLGLEELADRQIGELSGGQQQRALLARALVQEADLLLLDEPLNALDADTRDSIMRALDDAQRAGKTALIITHDLERLAEDFDRVVELRDGRVVADRPAALFEPPFSPGALRLPVSGMLRSAL